MTPEDNLLFEALHNERAKFSEYLKKPSYRGAMTSVIDKYPDSAHFIYELLQNADDAKASQVKIILDEKYLIFKHNGTVAFTISEEVNAAHNSKAPYGHINSITSIGASTKNSDQSNKIGKFGVGFKAVFQYTNRPEIYDDNFQFAIEDHIVPILLKHDNENREKNETLFYLPFKDYEKSFTEIHEKLKNLENPILFLQHIQQVTWQRTNSEEKFTYSKHISNTFLSTNINCELTHINNCEKEESLWIFHKEVHLRNCGSHFIAVGFYLNADQNNINTNCRPKIHCFFPTSESFHQCFISHAPFLLVDSRQQIKQKEPINKFLVKQISKLAAETLPILRDIGVKNDIFLLNKNLFTLIENAYDPYGDTHNILNIDIFYQNFITKTKEEKLILSRQNKYLSCKDAFSASPVLLVKLLSAKQLNELYNNCTNSFDFIADTSDSISKKTLNLLEIKEFTSQLLAEKISSKFMDIQEHSWVVRFYKFLKTDALILWHKTKEKQEVPFRFAPIILNTKNKWVPAFKKDNLNVFFSNNVNLDNYNFVSQEYVEDLKAKDFFDALGIKELDHENEINFIIQKYDQPTPSIPDNEIIQDFKILYSYSNNIPSNKKDNYLQKLKETFCCKGFNNEDNVNLYKISELYDNSPFINEFYKNSKDKINLINYKFYNNIIEIENENTVKDFLFSIGLNKYPTISSQKTQFLETLNERQKQQLNINRYTQINLQDYLLIEFDTVCITKFLSKHIWTWFTTINVEEYITVM